ncbi:MAG: energy transducer TonB, partial [Candidatus Sumerlaeota bacterium]
QNPWKRNILSFALITSLHALAIAALLDNESSPNPASSPQSLVMIYFRPAIRDAGSAVSNLDLSMLMIRSESPLDSVNIPTPTMTYDAPRNPGATVSAPSLRPDNAVSLSPFLAQAGLRIGEGATVILRIEVLPTGEPGAIAIDVSSGNFQVDQAAIGYARQQRWYAGREGDTPQSMWIRWGVRLQA